MKYYEGCEEITREKTRDFQAKMKLGYDFKKAYAARRAWEFYNHPEVAELLNCRPSEIYFTSGGTEADNWAIRAARYGDGHVVASAFEHHAIIHALEAMAREKERHVELVKPERDGIVDPERVRRNVSQYTNLVTVMAANNEVGTIQPVEEIGREIRKGGNKRTIFHTDAVQAVGHIPVDVQKMGVDMLSLSAHKFGGPKGGGRLVLQKRDHSGPAPVRRRARARKPTGNREHAGDRCHGGGHA